MVSYAKLMKSALLECSDNIVDALRRAGRSLKTKVEVHCFVPLQSLLMPFDSSLLTGYC